MTNGGNSEPTISSALPPSKLRTFTHHKPTIMLPNLQKPFRNTALIFTFIFLVILWGYIWWTFTDIRVMFGNYGAIHTYTDITLSLLMIIGFPLFLIGMLYKWLKFGHKENLHHKSWIGTVGGIIGTILSGCSCCGLTLASYFWLLPLMNLLPYDGLEIKVLGTLGLLWALHDTYRNLEVCRMPKKTK